MTEVKLPATITIKKPLSQITDIKELMSSEVAYRQLSSVINKHLNPEQMMRVVANAVRVTPRLQQCDPMSFLGALMTSGQLGLIPNTVLGHSYLVPFWSGRRKTYEVQLIVGYKGYIDLAYRSGKVLSVHADAVWSDDPLWEYEQGSRAIIRHRRGPREGEPIAAYCVAKTIHDGMNQPEAIFEVLPWSDVMRARNKSQGWRQAEKDGKQAEHPWSEHLPVMAAKTAVRYMANRGAMPMSIDYIHASSVDEQLIDYSQIALGEEDPVMIESSQDETVEMEVPVEPKTPEPEKAPARRGRPPKAAAKAPMQANPAPADDGPRNAAETPSQEEVADAGDIGSDIVAQKVNMVWGDVNEARNQKEVENLLKFYADTLDEISGRDAEGYERLMQNIADHKLTLPLK
jgi:recombination protein RecT